MTLVENKISFHHPSKKKVYNKNSSKLKSKHKLRVCPKCIPLGEDTTVWAALEVGEVEEVRDAIH